MNTPLPTYYMDTKNKISLAHGYARNRAPRTHIYLQRPIMETRSSFGWRPQHGERNTHIICPNVSLQEKWTLQEKRGKQSFWKREREWNMKWTA
mmetsp:Transcript_24592/g.37429  ORF Transcript_24592/g.37429 Transcript_24592/m.37429 type:complete len:94 (+) Transcript_24592:454-735(+)